MITLSNFKIYRDCTIAISKLLLSTLPKSYKEEAISCYWEDTKNNYVYESFQYCLGGIVYRFRVFLIFAEKVLSGLDSVVLKISNKNTSKNQGRFLISLLSGSLITASLGSHLGIDLGAFHFSSMDLAKWYAPIDFFLE